MSGSTAVVLLNVKLREPWRSWNWIWHEPLPLRELRLCCPCWSRCCAPRSKPNLIEEVEAEQQALASPHLNGGTAVNVVAIARRKAERDKALQRAKDAVAEIDATGVQVKEPRHRAAGFPCIVGEEVILLCWELGEKGITHWHGMEEGFAGRKPIDERILRDQRKSN